MTIFVLIALTTKGNTQLVGKEPVVMGDIVRLERHCSVFKILTLSNMRSLTTLHILFTLMYLNSNSSKWIKDTAEDVEGRRFESRSVRICRFVLKTEGEKFILPSYGRL